jgi:hypothetical protein
VAGNQALALSIDRKISKTRYLIGCRYSKGTAGEMKAKLFLMLALAVAGGSVQAAKRTRIATPRLASTLQVFGFTLGQSPTLVICPTTREGLFDSNTWSASLDSTCMDSPTHGAGSADGRGETMLVHFSRSDEPLLASGIHARGFALQILDGTVQGIFVRTGGAHSQKGIYAALRKKYGVPAALAMKHRQNERGATVDGISAAWLFSNLRVTFEGIGLTPDEGSLSITTPGSFEHAANPPPSAFPTDQ